MDNDEQLAKRNQIGTFSAVDSSLGYLYQVRAGLLWALRRMKTEPDFGVSLETLDDVTFESTGGEATDLLQTKHHRSAKASLTNASPDLWKTLRIWFEGHLSREIPSSAKLFLITTAKAAENSAASWLSTSNRDVVKAQNALHETATSSTSQTNRSGYDVYLKVSAPERNMILDRIAIIDSSPTITDLDGELKQEVYWAAGKKDHDAFLERLEGWWLRRVILQLTASPIDRIGSVELEAMMSDLRDQFKTGSLPIDEDLLEFILDDATKMAHLNFGFVKQLEIIEAGKRRIAAAIREYYRAYEQRSRWLRDDLVVGLDLHKYEKRLFEEWEFIFEAMRDEIGDEATMPARLKAARSILAWAERTVIHIRPNVTEPFICRGSLHMLSDEGRIGWHPDFRDLLSSILGGEEEVV